MNQDSAIIQADDVHLRINKCMQLTNGLELNLSDLNLSAIPADVMKMSSLRLLNLRNNQFARLPIDFVDCFPKLETLNLAQNSIQHLPPDIGGLQKLKKLYVQGNQLKSLPMSMATLIRLEELFVQHNHIHEIPSEFSSIKTLTSLSLAHNDLTSLPAELEALKMLKLVDLSGNTIVNVPEHLRRLHNKHAVLHSREKRRELIKRALKVKNGVAVSLKLHARKIAIDLG